MIAKLLLAAFLAGHGLVHAGFVSPAPPATASGPAWPFALDRSWALTALGVDAAIARLLGTALVAVVVGAYLLAAVAGLVGLPAGVFEAGVIVGSIASVAVLTLFFHPWLVLGLAIDAVLLWLAIVDRSLGELAA